MKWIALIVFPNRLYAGAYLEEVSKRLTSICFYARIRRSWGGVICEAQAVPIISPPLIEKSLIGAVPATLGVH